MLLFNQLIQSSIGYSSDYLYLIPNNPPAIRKYHNIEFLQTKSLSSLEIEEIIKSILKVEEYNTYKTQGFFNTTLTFNNSYQLYIHISYNNQDVKLIVNIIKNEPIVKSEFEKELDIMINKLPKGLLLFTGDTYNSNNYTLPLILQEINNNQKKHTLIFSDNNVPIPKANKSLINIYNLSQADPMFIKNQAADIILLSNFNNINLIQTAIICINMGLPVIAFIDAISCSCALESIAILFPHKKSILSTLSTHLTAIVTQIFINRAPYSDSLYLYDITECNADIKQHIREDKLLEIKNSGIIKKINQLIDDHQIHYHDIQEILKKLSDTDQLSSEFNNNDFF